MNKIVLILLILLTMLIISLFILKDKNKEKEKNKEGFQVYELKPITIKTYNDFLSFYNTFCSNWQKSIKSSVASQIPQQPLTSPSQVNSGIVPDIPEGDMNNYISILSQQLSQSLPPICKTLPQLDANLLPQLIKEVPKSTGPFINALNWMNTQLEQSQANLGSALKGNPPPIYDNFEDICDNVSACFDNNPEFVKKIALDLAEQQRKEQEYQEDQLVKALKPFLIEVELRRAFNKNIQLFKQAQEIQNKAASGELLNEIKIPDTEKKIIYTKPPGANNLINMKQNNPARYNEIQTNYKQLFSLKKLFDQINFNI